MAAVNKNNLIHARIPRLIGLMLGVFGLPGVQAQDPVINEIHYHPVSADSREEFIELYNPGNEAVQLEGWRISGGLDFVFPELAIPANGHVIAAADVDAFLEFHAGFDVARLAGGWAGQLSNRRETIVLSDASGREVDRVSYADEGDWASLRLSAPHFGLQGWEWHAAHDGEGMTIELINPNLPNDLGQNWAASESAGGTPGAENSARLGETAPMIFGVRHAPLIPRSHQAVAVNAWIADEDTANASASLFYRVDGAGDFIEVPMAFSSSTAGANERLASAEIPPASDGSVTEFYLRAADADGRERYWPKPVPGESLPSTFLHYQTDDRTFPEDRPVYRLIMSPSDHEFFLDMVRRDGGGDIGIFSNAQVNATFLYSFDGKTEARYRTLVRNRGNGSRFRSPNNYRVNIPSDEPWEKAVKINLNIQYPYVQLMGAVVARRAGFLAAESRLGLMLLNNQNRASGQHPVYGFYVHNEVIDGDFAEAHLAGDPNIYRGIRLSGTEEADFQYLGEDPAPYRRVYFKETNKSLDDWSDLIQLTRELSSFPAEADYEQRVRGVIDVEQWMRYLALQTFFSNNETNLGNGYGDDYCLYRDPADGLFRLIPYDMDTVLGQGDFPGGAEDGLWLAERSPLTGELIRTGELLRFPEFTRIYYRELKVLVETVFALQIFNPLVDQVMGDRIPAERKQSMKDFAAARSAYVLSQIPEAVAIDSGLPREGEYYIAAAAQIPLSGRAPAIETRQVWVNGFQADWSAREAKWTLESLPLREGVNQIRARALDANGNVVGSQSVMIRLPSMEFVETGGTLDQDTVFKASDGPRLIRQSLVVAAGATLTVEPGTTLYFTDDAGLAVRGRLVMEGTADEGIHLSPEPTGEGDWTGVEWIDSREDNRLSHVVIDGGTKNGASARVVNSNVTLNQVQWTRAWKGAIQFENASLVVDDCVFPSLAGFDVVRGVMGIQGGLVVRDSMFAPVFGAANVVVVENASPAIPLPMVELRDNRFEGGEASGVSINDVNAYITGNEFHGFLAAEPSSSSSAIRIASSEGLSVEAMLSRNIIYNCQSAIGIDGSARFNIHNNTIHNVFGSVLNGERTDGSEASILNTIVSGATGRLTGESSSIAVRLERCLLAQDYGVSGEGNLIGDPRYAIPGEDWELRKGSPALKTGLDGIDLGAMVPEGRLFFAREPFSTPSRRLTVPVWGPGLIAYRYRLDQGEWSEPRSMDAAIELDSLSEGPHELAAQGMDFSGAWLDEGLVSTLQWSVDPSRPFVVINELMALNNSVDVASGFPDWVELYNRGDNLVELGGMSVTDDPDDPRKYVFPDSTIIQPGEYLILLGGDAPEAGTEDLYLGFALAQEGEFFGLYDTIDRGTAPMDAVTFGSQLEGYSVGRLRGGDWGLTHPTPAASNQFASTGGVESLRINEWQALDSSASSAAGGFVELYNRDRFPVELFGLYFTDEPGSSIHRYSFRTLSFLAGEDFLTFALDAPDAATLVRLDFNHDAGPGYFGLYRNEGDPIDMTWHGPLRVGESQGRIPDGSDLFQSFSQPTPGERNSNAAEPTPDAPVVINEIAADNRSVDFGFFHYPDWVELYNPSTEAADLSFYSLTDRLEEPERWTFAAGTVVEPGSYLIVEFNPGSPASSANAGFGLSAEGDAVYLFDRSSGSSLLADSIEFGFQAPDVTLGRTADSPSVWAPCWPTVSAPNQPVEQSGGAMVRVNEWMADPLSGDDWLELYNAGSNPVDVGEYTLTDDSSQPAKSRLPTHSILGSGVFGYRRLHADARPDLGADRLGFRIAAAGEFLGLYSPDLQLVDWVDIGPQKEGESQGRFPDGATMLAEFPNSATPGASNFLDKDEDGMADDWEARAGLDAMDGSDGSIDSDLDGIPNSVEYRAGSDPFDPESRLNLRLISVSPGETTLEFILFPAKRCLVQEAARVEGSAWNDLAELPARADEALIRFTLPRPDGSENRFFRLSLQPE